MTLDPTSYVCAAHNADLTIQVTEALDDEAPPLAYWSLRKPAGARPFQVIVTCPGSNGTGAHQLTCSGTWAR